MEGIQPRLCNTNFLADDGFGNATTEISLFINFEGTNSGPHPPDRLVLVMYNPTRYLKIPID